jgi:protein-tyrosine-phosphatase
LGDAVRAFAAQDAVLATQTMAVEETVDALRTELNAELLQLFREGRIAWEQLHPLMTVARRLERVSDQARSLCLDTIYARTGEDLKHPGADTFRILFVDRHHATLSLMAECIGRGLRQPRFLFASAGVDPKPVDPRTLRFMQARGHDLSRVAPKSVDELSQLARFDVVVALDDEARKAFPDRSRRFLCLQWSMPDPARAGGEAETQTAFEACYQFLAEHIPSLVQAILGETAKRRAEA